MIMGFWDALSDFWFGPGRSATGKLLAGQAGQVPTATPANSYEELLKSMAEGRGPSLAEAQYRRAAQDSVAGQIAASRGRGPGAARIAADQAGRMGQGIAQGSAEARTREQMGAIQQGAGIEQQRLQMDQQARMANQNAYLQALQMANQQGGFGQMLAGALGQGLGAYAMLRGPRGPAPGGGGGGALPSAGFGGPFGGFGAASSNGSPWDGGDGWWG